MEMGIKKVLLIDPPSVRFMGETQPYTPLGLAYIAGVLAENNYDVMIYNADLEHAKRAKESGKAYSDEVSVFDKYIMSITTLGHPVYMEVLSTVEQYGPDIIGMTVRTGKFFIAKTVVEMLKKRFPDIPVVIGGNHVTADPGHSLARIKADYGIRGEGEYSFLRLVKALSENDGTALDMDGLSYRKDGKIVHNPPARLIEDLDRIPFPNRDALMYNSVMAPEHFGNIFASRGCPFACTFCDSRTTWTRKVRRRSPKNVVDELVSVKERHGTSFFTFNDDCFVTKKEDTFALCDEIDGRGLSKLPKKEFRWWCEIHPNIVTEELVERMKKSGCVAIAIGVESGSQRTLDHIHKANSVDVIRKAANAIKKFDVDLVTFAMIGFPWETEGDIRSTVDLLEELEPITANLSVFTPLPGTELHRDCEKDGLINYGEDFLNLYYFRSSHFYNPGISKERSEAIIRESFARVDDLIARTRTGKIERTLEGRIFPGIKAAFGTKFSLNHNNGADVAVRCDQRYADAAIRLMLTMKTEAARRADLAGIKHALSTGLLDELPQYSSVRIDER